MKIFLLYFSLFFGGLNLLIVHVSIELLLSYAIYFIALAQLKHINFSFRHNLIAYQVVLYLSISHLTIPLLNLIGFIEFTPELISNQLILGIIFISFALLFIRIFKAQLHRYKTKTNRKFFTNNNLYALITCMFSLTFLSYFLGLGKMGQETIVLPFKLTGIINYSRTIFLPYIFVLVLDGAFRRYNKLNRFAILFFIIWCLFEAFIRNSRSALIEYSLPLFLYLIILNIIPLKKLIRYIILLIALNVLLYPILTSLRYENDYDQMKASESKNEKIWKRTFSNPFYYQKYYSYVHDDIFNFDNTSEIIKQGGTHNFTTNIVDNLSSINKTHNSGTTGLMDGYIFGGIGFSLAVLIFSVLLSVYFDQSWKLSNPLEVTYGFMIVKWLIWHRSISLFLSPIDLVVFLLLYLLIRNK